MFRNNKHTQIETSSTRRWFNDCIRKQHINLLNNGMVSCSHLHIELLEITEQGRAWPKLKMVTLNHIKHTPVRSNASQLIQEMVKHTNLKPQGWGWWGDYGLLCSRSANPYRPLLPCMNRTGRNTTTSRLLAIWMILNPTLEVRYHIQRGTTRLWPRPLLHSEMEPSLWPGFANSPRGEKTETSLWRTVAEPMSETSL